MSKQDNVISVAFKPQRQSDESSDVQVRQWEGEKDKDRERGERQRCQRELDREGGTKWHQLKTEGDTGERGWARVEKLSLLREWESWQGESWTLWHCWEASAPPIATATRIQSVHRAMLSWHWITAGWGSHMSSFVLIASCLMGSKAHNHLQKYKGTKPFLKLYTVPVRKSACFCDALF